jgi:hypothetical protein
MNVRRFSQRIIGGRRHRLHDERNRRNEFLGSGSLALGASSEGDSMATIQATDDTYIGQDSGPAEQLRGRRGTLKNSTER